MEYKPSILHIDDDGDFLDFFQLRYKRWFNITPLNISKDVVKALQSDSFEAVITDFEMPSLNGLEVLKAVKAESPETPVIFYTGQGNEDVAREAFIHGASDYFVKELAGFVHREKLVNSVIRAIDARKAKSAKKESEEKYRQIFENIKDVYFEISLDGKIIEVSPSVKDLFRIERQSVLGQFLPDMLTAPFNKNFIPEVLKKDKITDFEINIIDGGGDRIPCSVNVQTIRDNQGNPLKISGAVRDISDRKKNEELIHMKLNSLTKPVSDKSAVSFLDLFNINEIQKIQDAFADATGVASIITYPDGRPLTLPSNFCRLCKDIIRKTEKGLCNCMNSDAALGRLNPGGPIMQPCLSGGLWDGGASISAGDNHIANWLIGQVRNDAQNEEQMLKYADEIGADRGEFGKALQEVTVMSTEQFGKVCEALYLMANQMSQMAYQNLQQARFIAERKKYEEAVTLFKTIVETSKEAIIIIDPDDKIIHANPAFLNLFDIQSMESGSSYLQDIFTVESYEIIRAKEKPPSMTGDSWEGIVNIQDYRSRKFPLWQRTDTIRDEDGEILLLFSFMHDATAEVNAIEEKRERMDRARSFQEAILRLTYNKDFVEGNVEKVSCMLTEIISKSLDVERVGIWLLSNDGGKLTAVDIYEKRTDIHISDVILESKDYPRYFEALYKGRVLETSDTLSDPRTSEFISEYLMPHSVTSMMDASIRVGGKLVGVVCHEHIGEKRIWQPDEITFAGEVADLVAQVMLNSERKKAERRLSRLNKALLAIRNVNQLLARESDPGKLIQESCQILIETRGYVNAWILLLDENRRILKSAEAGIGSRFERFKALVESENIPNCALKAIESNKIEVILDRQVYCLGCYLNDSCTRQFVFTTKLEFEGRYYGLISAGIPEESAKDDEERELFSELAEDISYALYRLEIDNCIYESF
ncbi:MAG: PocR ligand-binding domain-containing protein [Firmicutes bacterium]|nr:PocR ligand-binding domain-containing protein [Bacillota bacterium]